ncbi:hypothetical protein BUALT_Bualt09G0053500 [Buddleja alternifolia]|uniref:Sodium transporter HKT1 n=1 Tax=Buddleja alternifolia TaxID=168488 RepID=A0AAV6XAX0_9LAMI|nr:hypothetical protein BUALT_Bualt09G0053500 [Buddleja alternifolia]
MKIFADSSKKLKHMIISCCLVTRTAHLLLFQLNPFWIELAYFITLSSLGFLSLKATNPRTVSSLLPKDIDLFFTSVSAATVSSMSTVEMEVFSNIQLVFLTFLMLFGGVVFTSMLGLHLTRAKMNRKGNIEPDSSDSSHDSNHHIDQPGMITNPETEEKSIEKEENQGFKLKSIKILSYLVLGYLVLVHALGSTLISIYLSLIPSAGKVLKRKGLNMQTFSIFTTVSTFSNCGFVPTNENMVIFKKNSGLLLILIPLILMGNTLYPVFLRLSIFFMEFMTKRAEFRYMLKNSRELGYGHLLPGVHSVYLMITVLGFIVVQLIVFCLLEWNSEATSGISGYEKVVGSLFQVVNSRHTGESVFDLSAISQAILVLFVVMMYLPPYTSFLPIQEAENVCEGVKSKRKNKDFWEHILFSQLTYLTIFIILICITERQQMKKDPLNFNVLNIVLEVISAYGNVGFTIGYSCERQIIPDGQCKDKLYGFAGKWSGEGKFVLIVVMFFGRLKNYNMRGGRAWRLL